MIFEYCIAYSVPRTYVVYAQHILLMLFSSNHSVVWLRASILLSIFTCVTYAESSLEVEI